MIDLWLDREAAEMDSQQYFEEMSLDDHLIKLWEEAQDRDKLVQKEVDSLLEQGLVEVLF